MKDKEKAVYLRPFYRTHQGALYPYYILVISSI